jgi:hypothetical protein
VYEDALDVLCSKSPEHVEASRPSVGCKLNSKQPTNVKINIEASKMKETLGFTFVPFQKAVEEIARQEGGWLEPTLGQRRLKADLDWPEPGRFQLASSSVLAQCWLSAGSVLAQCWLDTKYLLR